MRMVVLVLLLCLAVAGGALAANPIASVGGGGMNVLGSDRQVVWSEPPNLDGLIITSEVISDYALESEVANDFSIPWFNGGIAVARWWGAYFSNIGCGDIGVAINWNLRLYDDSNCAPGSLRQEVIGAFSNETFVGCQAGAYPVFQYQVSVFFNILTDTRYWFSAQASNHGYPPQVGRIASASVVGCESNFRSAFFAYPDWVPVLDLAGVDTDFSQEFEDADIPPPDWGACCIGDQGECQELANEVACQEMGGRWQGYSVPCDPNPCDITPVKSTTWGQIKSQYR